MADSAPMSPARAPTERSICPATMTSTMPMARMEVTDICRASSERLRGLRKVPSVVMENTTQITIRAPTMVSARHGMRGVGKAATATGDGGGSMTGWTAAISLHLHGRGGQHRLGARAVGREVGRGTPEAQHEDPMAHPQQLRQVRGDEHHAEPPLGEGGDELIDLGLGAHVDAARGLVQEQH